MSLRPGCMVRAICGQLRTSCVYLGSFSLLPPHPPPLPPLPSPPPTHLPPTPSPLPALTHPPPSKSGLKLMHTFKNSSKIKQGTTSKVNCILFNRLLNSVLLSKSGLVRAKTGNFNPKSLNRCFSNYYQVRTWRVFVGHK